MIAFYPIVIGSALAGLIGPWVLSVLGIPRLVQVLRQFSKPRPESPPHSYVKLAAVVRRAFIHTRRAGATLIVGLLLERLPAGHLPWLT